MGSSAPETQPLLSDASDFKPVDDLPILPEAGSSGQNPNDGDDFDAVPQSRRQMGLTSSVFLIVGRVVGTGVFATSAAILNSSGSVGMALIMWLTGAIIACAGLAVYVEWGTGLPRSGGEKNYLEYVYRRPRFLITCMLACHECLLGRAAGNSTAFGEYVLHAAGVEVNRWNQRVAGLACMTFAWLIHSVALKWGLRLQNILGALKVIVLLLIVFSGMAVLTGHIQLPDDQQSHNFRHPFEGTRTDPNALVTGLYNIIWTFHGYSNANYAMSEMKHPVRTIKRAGPIAMAIVAILYMFVNIAYFAAVPKADIMSSGRIVAALYFRNVFGPNTERALSVVIALSALGSIMAVSFAGGRMNQELAREGVIPFSKFFASNKPFGTPFTSIGLHWASSAIIMLAPPPGDAFNFVIALGSYPYAVINAAISGGLLFLYLPYGKKNWDWHPPFRATIPVTVFFFLSNVFLSVAPFVPPEAGRRVYQHLPYYLHAVVGASVFVVGAFYWLVYWVVLPKLGRYTLEREIIVEQDGVPRAVFNRVPK